MKTTLELTYKEICLICRMANKYIQSLDERITFDDGIGITHKWADKEKKETFEFWEKIEKIENRIKYKQFKLEV